MNAKNKENLKFYPDNLACFTDIGPAGESKEVLIYSTLDFYVTNTPHSSHMKAAYD